MLANINRNSEKKPEPYTPQDFMPGQHEPEPKVTTPADELTLMRLLNASCGGTEIIT